MSYQVYKEYLDRYYNGLDQQVPYVVAYFSAHVGALEQKIIYAKSKLKAINTYLDAEYESMEQVDDVMSASDSWINALEVSNTLTE